MLNFPKLIPNIFLITILLKISKIFSQQTADSCYKINPNDDIDCFLNTNSTNYCCYLYLTNEIKELYNNTLLPKLCLSIYKDKYNKLGNINYYNINYRINCGIGTQILSGSQISQAGKNCSIDNPKTANDCYNFSTTEDQCCFYNYKNLTGCYILGTTFNGYSNSDDISLVCKAIYLKFFGIKFVFLIISILILYN